MNIKSLFTATVIAVIFSANVAEAAEPPVRVSSIKLFSDYDSNEVVANNKYKGKTLIVTGRIEEITDEYVALSAGEDNFLNSVDVKGLSIDEISMLRKNRSITVECIGDGVSSFVGDPQLDNCKLLQ